MNRFFSKLFFSAGILSSLSANATNFWHKADAGLAPKQLQVQHPTNFLVYTLDEATLKVQLWNLSSDPNDGIIITLPLPDGTFRDFKVWQTSLMPDELAARYPEIRSFTGEATDDRRVTAKLDFTLYGFDAMIYNGENTSFVDPYDNYHDGFYMVHYKRDETRALANRMTCLVKSGDEDGPAGESMDIIQNQLPKLAAKTVNGWNLRTYRLALSADHFYCQAATGLTAPTIAQALSKMTISMNRINGVYNREFSVQMNFVTKEDTLIWPTATGSINGSDPFNAIDANAGACLTANQTQCTNRIGSANYDVGHVFTTGGGGLSNLGVVCNNSSKAKSVTGSSTPVGDGFDIDYVAHEMGHEFGSEHTFNNNADGSCGGNAVSADAYEPGSGSTIMAYAGICPPDDLQPHSDAYFHASSLQQIVTKLNGSENACAVSTPTGNKTVYLPAFSASYTIPYKTPFELVGPAATDSVADTLNTYCWEQWNRGDFGKRLVATFFQGPIFRSYSPVTGSTRVFPKVSMVLAGNLSNAGVENAQGEKAADTARFMTFKMTVRDIIGGHGCVTFPDDTIHVTAVSTGAANAYAGFKVTSQNTSGIVYDGGTVQTVTWNVVSTDVAPVSAANVTIYMSTDGGYTWPYNIGTFPNTGTASVTLPNPAVTTFGARFKVKGTGNVFFNVNKNNFTVNYMSTIGVTTSVAPVNPLANDIKIFPVPASNMLHIATANNHPLQALVYNSLGRAVWSGQVNGKADIEVSEWAKGIYYVRFEDLVNGNRVAKSFVIE
jgi:Metallo-peptidase family M12/Secretion system C-terminal sorting domain